MKHSTSMPIAILLLLAHSGCLGIIDDSSDAPTDPAAPDNPDDPNDPDGRSLTFYYGPMKLMLGESILDSVSRATGHDFGAWDSTAPDPSSQAFIDAGNATAYYLHCRLMGGCMEHRIPQGRTSFVGTAYVLELEKSISEACYDRAAFGMFPDSQAPQSGVQPIDVIRHQYRVAFSSEPSESDLEASIAYFAGHIDSPEFTDVSPIESTGRGHCRALLTTNRFLFY